MASAFWNHSSPLCGNKAALQHYESARLGLSCLLCSDRWSRALIGSRWRAISQVAPWKNIPAHKSNYKRAGFLTPVRVRPATDHIGTARAFPR